MNPQIINHDPLQNAVSSNMIAMILTSIIMEKLKLTTMYYGMIHGLIISLIPLLSTNYLDLLVIPDLYHVICCFGMILLCGLSYLGIKRYYKIDYLVVTLYSPALKGLFKEYINYQKEYYPQNNDYEYGDIDSILEQKLKQQHPHAYMDYGGTNEQIDKKIEFDDKFLNIKGYYVWKKKTKSQNSVENKVIFDTSYTYLEINIIKTNKDITANNIIEKIREYNRDQIKNEISLTYYKVLIEKIETKMIPYINRIEFYDGEKKELQELENKYIYTIFHPKRDELWSAIKNNILNPEFYRNKGQVGRISYLLHGPPGTGKSSFVFRIAMCLYRSIVSLDLRVLNKVDMYKVFNSPHNLLQNRFPESNYNKYIYLFEEFDISIKYLYYKQLNSNKNKNKYISTMESIYLKEKDTEEKEEKNDDSSIIDCDRDQFMLRDLLEIFQGPVPLEGMIILASTNKYDEIHKLCPELFRPGRMTPIHFGYIDRKTLQEISMYFFKEKLTGYIPDNILAPSSEIIDIALEASQLEDKQFEFFSQKINKLLDR